ncbi:MAG: MXAN_5187 C-terminal domain-containing protein [Polyangia bacterium]|jgi:hypothetical protein|nr:MXAN_5187 C-terminal domain-containing protein [Polyangia bacterium]
MVKGQHGIVAAVLAIALTVAAYLLVSRDSDRKAGDEAKARTQRGVHIVSALLGKEADTAKAVAQHFAGRAVGFFTASEKYEATVAAEVARAADGLGEAGAPDFAGMVSTARVVVWSRMGTAIAKAGTTPGYATNRLFEARFADPVFSGKLPFTVGELPWAEGLAAPTRCVAVPLLGEGKKVVGVVILAWKGKSDERELRTLGEQFRDKLDVLAILETRTRLEAVLSATFSDQLPEEISRLYGVRASFVGLLDAQGVLLQRNDRSRLFVGQPLVPGSLALQTARAQRMATSELWLKASVHYVKPSSDRGEDLRPEILRVGFAPVNTDRGRFAGLLVLAWELGDVHASDTRRLSGAHVAYLHGANLCTSTIKQAVASKLAALPRAKSAIGDPGDLPLGKLEIRGEQYVAASVVMPGAGSDAYVFVVLASMDDRRAAFGYARALVLILGLCMAITFILVGWLLRRHFILPISELERGVGDIVAGNTEYKFGVASRETEGLAYSLNVLMAQVLGRPEPGDEVEGEGEEASESAMQFALGPLPDRPYRPGDSQLIPRLDESRDAHIERIFKDYMAAMQQLGEDTSGFSIKTFRSKLEVNERMICARLKCSEVRFSVVLADDGVVLNPYPVA